MMQDGWKTIEDTSPSKAWKTIDASEPDGAAWRDRVTPVDLGNGMSTVQREDGAFWLDTSKGFNVRPGWYDMSGNQVGDAPGQQVRETGAMGLVNRFAQPVKRAVLGGAQLVERGLYGLTSPLMSDETKARYLRNRAGLESDIVQDERQYEATKYVGPGGGVAELAGNFAVPLPGGAGGGALMRYVGRPAMQGALGAMLQPVYGEREQVSAGSDPFLSAKAAQATVGAGAGILGNLALRGGEKALGKALNFAKGDLKPYAQKVIQETEAQRVPFKPSEIAKAAKPPTDQIKSAEAAVNRLSQKLTDDIKRTPFSGLKDIEAAAAKPGPRQGAAKALLEQVNNTGDDASDIVQTSAGLSALREKMRMDQLGKVRAELAEGVDVDPSRPVAVIDRLLEDVSGVDASKWPQKQALIDKLQKMKAGLTSSPNSFKSMMKTRSDIGDELSDYFKGNNAEIGQKGSSVLQQLKTSINDAMSEAAQKSGKQDLAAADKLFNREYTKFAGTFKDPAVVKAITTSDPDQIVTALTKAGEDKAQRIFNALEPKGRRAFAKATFDEAIRTAYDKRTGEFIPGAVAAGIFDKSKALGVTFTGDNRVMLDGVKKVMQHLAKADPRQASALGERMVDSGAHVSKTFGIVQSFMKAVKEGGADFLFDSPAGKRFLFAATGVKTGSPAMDDLIAKFMQKAPGVAGMEAGKAVSGGKR